MENNRRNFIKKAGLTAVGLALFPTIVKPSVLGLNGSVAPSEKIEMILIGSGSMGMHNLNSFLNFDDIRVVAICDLDSRHLANGKRVVDEKYGNSDCRVYTDYRELLDKEKTDAAILALPDHWHALVSIAVVEKGINVYGEKPLARSIAESRAIVNAVNRNGVTWQTGSQQRSERNFHLAAEAVRNNRIGKVDYVEVGLPNGGHYAGNPQVMNPPSEIDWDKWLGPAPKVPYRGILHWNWRWIMDYSGGQLTDWAGHHIDIAHWGLGFDNTGPVTIHGTGRSNNDGIYNVPVEYDVECTYQNGVKIRVANESKLKHGMGVFWKGSDGWIHVNRSGLKASDNSLIRETTGNDIALYRSRNHRRNFLDCIKSGNQPIAPAEIAHRSISVALLAEISILTGLKLNWDPEKEQFSDNNSYATSLLKRPYREPYQFPLF